MTGAYLQSHTSQTKEFVNHGNSPTALEVQIMVILFHHRDDQLAVFCRDLLRTTVRHVSRSK